MKLIYIYGFRKLLTVGLMFIVTCCFVFQGCEKDENELELLDKVILNSSELEEYIIAGADLQQSLADFTARLKKIEFSKLEVTYDAKGRKVVRLFPSSVSNRIEEKVQTFNVKKKTLQKRFPQFVSFREDAAKEYFEQSIQNSIHINSELLKLGISNSRPRLKSGNEFYGEDDAALAWYLYNWVSNPDYVEIFIIHYEDGKIATYQDPQNDISHAYIDIYTNIIPDGRCYFPQGGSSSPIQSIGHTHLNSGSASPQDINTTFPGASTFIYYDGSYYYY